MRTRPAGGAALAAFLAATLLACTPAGPRASSPAPATPAEREEPVVRVPTVVRLGVVLPQGASGYLRQYSEAVLEGMRVAAAEREQQGLVRVELLVREAGTESEAAAAVRELAASGVVGIVGPLLEENVGAAADARPDTAMVIVQPTGTEVLARLPNAYALNVPDTLGASALGAYAGRSERGPVAVLRPGSGGVQGQARAFAAAFARVAGRAPLEVMYQPGATSYRTQLQRLRSARVAAVFVAAEEADLRQLLPQVSYYGLGDARLYAAGPWATPDGLERIGLRGLEGVVTTLPFLETDSAGSWRRFVRGYEALHRRSLETAIPALGYDAAALLLAGEGPPSGGAAQAARRLREGGEVAGATGTLVPMRGSVGRRPLLVRVEAGRVVPLGVVGQ